MAGKHSDDTRLLGFYANNELVAKVDAARKTKGLTRSQFLRDATVALVIACGIDVPDQIRGAPDRTGKGGPRRKPGTKRRTNRPGIRPITPTDLV